MRVNLVTYIGSIIIAFFTRKVLLDHLGTEFLGLTTTLNSLLGFLNLAELGVGVSIAYFLYKPLHDDNRSLVCETISVMGFLYRRIGLFILIAGIICSCFLPWIFADSGFSWGVVYYCFYAQLASSLIGYFINYRANTVFNADQRQYLVNAYFQLTQFGAVLLQALMAWLTGSYVIYISITLLFALVNSWILNWKCSAVYPWLKSDVALGREALKSRPEIMRYVRRVFVHQFGAFVCNSVLPIVIYGFASLSTVTLYGNYSMLNTRIRGLIFSAMGGMEASVGNLVAEGDKRKAYECYQELFSAKFFFIAVAVLCLWRYNSAFIAVWLGSEYVLPPLIVHLICLDLLLNLLRNTTDQFINSYGLKSDIWVPICRVASLGVMVLAGLRWGLAGILAVPVVFGLTFTHIWKPYYLYHCGFGLPFLTYVRLFLANALPLIIAFVTVAWGAAYCGYVSSLPIGWTPFLFESLTFSLVFGIVAFALSWPVNVGLRTFVLRRIFKQ